MRNYFDPGRKLNSITIANESDDLHIAIIRKTIPRYEENPIVSYPEMATQPDR